MTRIMTSALCIALMSCAGPGGEPKHPEKQPAPVETEKLPGEGRVEKREPVEVAQVTVELFIMSQCPFCSKVMQGFHDVEQTLGPYMNFKLEFIANQNEDGSFDCMHGESE